MDLKTVTKKGTKHEHTFRVGRGIGSGLGKTCGRGHKGWGARSGSSRRPGYEGGQMPIYRRVPKRGFTNARFTQDYTVINVDQLSVFETGEVVDLTAVESKGLARVKVKVLKVLGNGELATALTVRAQKFSKSAADKIRAAGGQVVLLDAQGREVGDEPAAPAKGKKAKAARARAARAQKAASEASEAEAKSESEGEES